MLFIVQALTPFHLYVSVEFFDCVVVFGKASNSLKNFVKFVFSGNFPIFLPFSSPSNCVFTQSSELSLKSAYVFCFSEICIGNNLSWVLLSNFTIALPLSVIQFLFISTKHFPVVFISVGFAVGHGRLILQ